MRESKRSAVAWMRRCLAIAAVGMLATTVVGAPDQARAEWPERPITVVVMYAAGGGTDTIMRMLADEMGKSRGWTINVINKPGAVGGIATQYVSAAPADGYTILGGANYNRFARVMGHADYVPWEDWVFMQAANALGSWSVRKDSPFETFEDVVAYAKEHPGEVTISTSGTGGVWHEIALLAANSVGIELKFVPYKGGKPATLAGLQGETDIAGGGVHEHIDLIRAGELRNLMHTGPADIEVEGVGTLRSLGSIVPEVAPMLPFGAQYNFIVKRDTPPEVTAEIQAAFAEAVESEAFKQLVADKYFQPEMLLGEEADRRAARVEAASAEIFNKHKDQIGAPVKTLDELGLPPVAEFDAWWPPEGYQPVM